MTTAQPSSSPDKPKLLDQVRTAIRLRRLSYRTEEAYTWWIKRFIVYHGKRHPAEMREPEIRDFLSHLVIKQNVAASTQNQALHALLFLYKEVLNLELPRIGSVVKARKPPRLPVVLTREEVQHLKEDLRRHLLQVRQAHEADLREGFGTVELPHALARKYPQAATEWKWQYVFPAPKRSIDPRSGVERRHHLYARPESRWPGRAQPARQIVIAGAIVNCARYTAVFKCTRPYSLRFTTEPLMNFHSPPRMKK